MISAAKLAPNETAERLMGRDYLSFSSLSLYQTCPLRWYFKYVAGLPEETVSSSLVFGGAIHRAVELHFNELLAGNPAPDLDTLLAAYQAGWQDRDPACVQFGKDETADSLGRLADRILRAFQNSSLAKPGGKIIGIEEELRGQLVPGCPDLLARIDLLVDTGDALVITDFKTARSRWSAGHADEAGEQLLLYSELVRRLAPEKSIRLEFAVITKTNEPVVDRLAVTVDPHRVARTKRVMQNVWRAIEGRHFFPSPSPMNCPTCPYRAPCRAWTG
ncbi:MAG TPA: PD-(D/E)XK nuclease family protein [Pirellulales bacterium]|jgi:putative RecB family exonuclease|nr:PD-(D/E)XK nuclease family protein [Pirellulales bacterium]